MHLTSTISARVVTRAVEDVWNTGAVDDLDRLMATGYVRHSSRGDTGRSQLKESILLTRIAFPDLRTIIQHQVSEGDMVATHWRSEGTHLGAFYDLPVTRKRVQLCGMTFSRVHDQQIVEEWENWDHTDLFATLGVVNLWRTR